MLEFQTKQNIGGVNDSRATTKAGALEQNSRNAELKTAVSSTGQTLTDISVQIDTNTTQLSKAMFIYGTSAGQMQDNGAANTIQLTPITGATGLRLPIAADGGYSILDGARFYFTPAFDNTGNVTVNVGQTGALLLGSKKLLNEDGTEIPAGTLLATKSIEIYYDSTADAAAGAFVLAPWSSPQDFGPELASQAEAEAGIENTKYMSSLRTKQAVDFYGGLVTQISTRTTSGIWTIPDLVVGKPLVITCSSDGDMSTAYSVTSGSNDGQALAVKPWRFQSDDLNFATNHSAQIIPSASTVEITIHEINKLPTTTVTLRAYQ